jgi:acyl carrier protein
MSQNTATLVTLTEILRDLLGDDTIVLDRETVRDDVNGRDSFNYVNFIVSVEMKYSIKFRIADVESFSNVGAIADKVEELTAGKTLSGG